GDCRSHTNTNTQCFTNITTLTTYTITESTPSNWTLGPISCSVASGTANGGSATPSGASVSINLKEGEEWTCTYTNTRKAHIIVDKVTNPSGDPASFTFATSGTGYTGFSLTDAAAPNDQSVVPGTYTVSENATAGWALTSSTCSLNRAPTNAYTPGINLVLGAGDTISCVFNNAKQSHIIVDKVTNPSGDSISFNFAATGSGYNNFSLTDAAAPNDQ